MDSRIFRLLLDGLGMAGRTYTMLYGPKRRLMGSCCVGLDNGYFGCSVYNVFFFWKLYRATGRAACLACEPVPARPTVSLFLLALCVHVRVLAASLSESERATTVQPRVELGPT
jgi:hypothetical protein